MHALTYDGELSLVEDYPRPAAPPGEALVKVLLAGICNTDIEITRGYMGFRGVLGHEFVGIVEESGQRVVGEINCPCGNCLICLRGIPTHCPNRTTLGILGRDGAMAEYLTLPLANLHPVPESVTDEEAVFVEPIAAALEVLEQAHIRPTERVVVLGDGKLGLLVAQVLSLSGCELIAIGRHEEKLAILRQRGIEARLVEKAGEIKADVVVECTGHPSGFETARKILLPRGRLILKSTFHGETSLNLSALVVDEITLIGSRCGPFPPALRLLERKLVEVKPLISAIYPLAEGLEAFKKAQEKGVLKVLLKMA
ncbi:MAG: MDR/zinc-dependent alcohol dehydrogenase-like family protein [Anaerolineae bacterium]